MQQQLAQQLPRLQRLELVGADVNAVLLASLTKLEHLGLQECRVSLVAHPGVDLAALMAAGEAIMAAGAVAAAAGAAAAAAQEEAAAAAAGAAAGAGNAPGPGMNAAAVAPAGAAVGAVVGGAAEAAAGAGVGDGAGAAAAAAANADADAAAAVAAMQAFGNAAHGVFAVAAAALGAEAAVAAPAGAPAGADPGVAAVADAAAGAMASLAAATAGPDAATNLTLALQFLTRLTHLSLHRIHPDSFYGSREAYDPGRLCALTASSKLAALHITTGQGLSFPFKPRALQRYEAVCCYGWVSIVMGCGVCSLPSHYSPFCNPFCISTASCFCQATVCPVSQSLPSAIPTHPTPTPSTNSKPALIHLTSKPTLPLS